QDGTIVPRTDQDARDRRRAPAKPINVLEFAHRVSLPRTTKEGKGKRFPVAKTLPKLLGLPASSRTNQWRRAELFKFSAHRFPFAGISCKIYQTIRCGMDRRSRFPHPGAKAFSCPRRPCRPMPLKPSASLAIRNCTRTAKFRP